MAARAEIDGYRYDIAFSHAYHREVSPASLRLLALARGWSFPASRPLRYLELGYGNGVSLNIHAAANPGEFWGTDINPLHVASAGALADAVGSGVRLLDLSFADFLKRSDLPRFDIIVAHSVWSWVSPGNRDLIVEIAKRHLVDGGIFFMSALSQPAEADAVPLQRLLRVQQTGDVRTALNLALALQSAGSPYFAAERAAAQHLEEAKTATDNYLVHQYFAADWQPCLFAETAGQLAEAGLSFVGGRDLLEGHDELVFSPKQCAMLASIGDPLLRETARDFLQPKRYRFDAFIKGERVSPSTDALAGQRFVLAVPLADALSRDFATVAMNVRFRDVPYRTILERLASDDHRPKRLDDLALSGPDMLRVLAPLADTGIVRPVLAEEETVAAAPACARLNAEILRRSQLGEDVRYLASPVTGGGIRLSRNECLFLLAYREGARSANEWVKAPLDVPRSDPLPTVPQLLTEALRFQTRLPTLRALHVLD
jgi:hypothetical protein